jgi:hypothetical protein
MKGRGAQARIAAFLLAQLAAATAGFAQFQSCVFCDVVPFNPDPFPVDPCDTGTLILQGIGYQNPAQNGCSITPVVAVRSTRTDRLVIVSFQVLSDGQIRVDYTVPCSASAGLVGIDVTIDDNPADAIDPYACGNARVAVQPVVLGVTYDAVAARRTAQGVEVRWRTLAEDHTLAFELWARDAAGVASRLDLLAPAEGPGYPYVVVDSSAAARAGRTVAYQLVERTDEGTAGDASGWFAVATPSASGASRSRRQRD